MIPGYEAHRRACVEADRAASSARLLDQYVRLWGDAADPFPAIESRDAMGRAALFTLVWLLIGDDE